MSESLDQLRDDLLTASLILDSEGLVEGYGHVSVRVPGQQAMIMTPRKGLGLLTSPDEMVVVGLDGQLIDGDETPALESIMHGEVYRQRPDVQALVRTHSEYVNIMGILGRKPRVVHGFGSFLGAEIPIMQRPLLITDVALARELAQVLGNAEAVLMRGNGDLVTGGNVAEATVKAIFLEESCRLQYLAMCAGEPQYFSDEERAIRSNPGYDHFGRAWEYYKARVLSEEVF